MTNLNMKGRISEIDIGNKTNLTPNDGHSIVDDDTLSQQKSHNFLIVTRGRSGSSFLGDLLNSYPGTFYSFEPLYKHRYMKTDMKGTKVIESIFKCMRPQFHVEFHIKQNFRYYNILQEKASKWKTSMKKLQESKQLFSSSCKKFPYRLVKTIRLPFKDVERLLLDPEMGKNLKVIFLFRDPRGRYQSLISKVHWGINVDISSYCNKLYTDVKEAINIKNQYPGMSSFYSIDKHIVANLYLKSDNF